jgi:predicted ester cyclase
MRRRLVFLVLSLGTFAGCGGRTGGGLTEAAATALMNTYAEARNTGKLDLLDSIMDSNVVMYDPTFTEPLEGLAVVKQFYIGTQSAFPDFHIEFDRVRTAGDVIVSEWTITGTQTGPLGELAPTGRAIHVSGAALSRVAGGRIIEDRVFLDRLTLMEQLGFSLAPEPAATAP